MVGIGLTACGGSSPDAGSLLNDAFHPAQRVVSGRLSLSFGLSGVTAAGPVAPLGLTIDGPFASAGAGRLPRFALTLSNSAQGRTVATDAISTGTQFFVRIGRTAFVAPPSAFAQLQSTYAQSAARSPGTGSTPLTSLGIDPGAWPSNPRVVGRVTLDGVQTEHISAGVDAPRFLADLNRVAGAGGELALAGSGASASGLSPVELAALSRSLDHASIDVYVGTADHVLRLLRLRASIDPPASARPALGGLLRGEVRFALAFSAVNRAVTIAAPAHALPLSTLITELERLGVGGQGAPAGSSGPGTTPATTTTSTSTAAAPSSATLPPGLAGAAPPAYLRCYEQAGQDLAARARCAPLLNGG